MKLRALLGLLVFGFAATAIALPTDTPDENPPKRITICHFPGHSIPEASDNFSVEGEDVSGDYVTNPPPPGGPAPNQVAFCESRGGKLIELSEKGAVNGHKVALQHRIAAY